MSIPTKRFHLRGKIFVQVGLNALVLRNLQKPQ